MEVLLVCLKGKRQVGREGGDGECGLEGFY